jgi:hypothetical protein
MTTPPRPHETLAIHGGRPVREGILPYGEQLLTDEDAEDVRAAVRKVMAYFGDGRHGRG